jgi:ribosomal protein S18 acetylase RimI-like enzyme
MPDDAEGIHHCLDTVAHERRHIAMVEAPSLTDVRAFLEEKPSHGLIQFVALVGGRIVGWCDVAPKPIEGFRHSAVLGMGVLPEYRRRGLGCLLLERVLQAARERVLTRIELEVYVSNEAAIALYERSGFLREGVKRSARVLDGRVEDICCMALLFPPLDQGAA